MSSSGQNTWVTGTRTLLWELQPLQQISPHAFPAAVTGEPSCQIKDNPLTSSGWHLLVFTVPPRVGRRVSIWQHHVDKTIKKGKNKCICKIRPGLFCDVRQHHIIWHEGQQWGGFGRFGGFYKFQTVQMWLAPEEEMFQIFKYLLIVDW